MLSLADAYKGKYDDIEVNEEDAVGDIQVFVPKSCLTKGTRCFVFVPRGTIFIVLKLYLYAPEKKNSVDACQARLQTTSNAHFHSLSLNTFLMVQY